MGIEPRIITNERLAELESSARLGVMVALAPDELLGLVLLVRRAIQLKDQVNDTLDRTRAIASLADSVRDESADVKAQANDAVLLLHSIANHLPEPVRSRFKKTIDEELRATPKLHIVSDSKPEEEESDRS